MTGQTVQETNAAIVRQAFETWRTTGSGIFDILDEEVQWTIVGSKPSGQTFQGRQAFLDGGFALVSEKFSRPMQPEIRGLYADGDTVVIRWDGAAPMKDGQVYRNSYAWFFTMRGGKVTSGHAFLDLPTYDAAIDGSPLPAWSPDQTSQTMETESHDH